MGLSITPAKRSVDLEDTICDSLKKKRVDALKVSSEKKRGEDFIGTLGGRTYKWSWAPVGKEGQ